MIRKDRLITIDPSINTMGIAIWECSSKNLLVWCLVRPDKDMKDTEYSKSLSMLRQVKKWIRAYAVNKMVLEVPEHWAVSGFQARETGSIAKLCFVCGMLYSLSEELSECRLVTPREWKGQLPKDVVANRLYKSYEKYGIDLRSSKSVNSNVADAIEIGHYFLHGSV